MENEIRRPAELEKIRKQKARRRFLKRVLVLALLTLGVALALVLRQDISNLGLGTKLADLYASFRPGREYPVEAPAGRVLDLQPLGNDLVVLGDTNLTLYNTTGRQMSSYQHGYRNPICRAAGDRVLTFDRGGRRLRVDSRSKALYEANGDESTIFSADISSYGIMAVLRSSVRYAAEAVVYDRQFQSVFIWYTSVGTVLDLRLDQQGKGMAVSAVSAKNGQLYSIITCLRFDSETPVAEITLEDQTVLSMAYTQEGRLQVLTDRAVLLFDPQGKQLAQYDYNGALLGRFINSSDETIVLVLDRLGDGGNLNLVSLGSGLKPRGSLALNGQVQGLEYDQGSIYLLTDDGPVAYDTDLKQPKPLPLEEVYILQPAGGGVYGVSGEQILRYYPEQTQGIR